MKPNGAYRVLYQIRGIDKWRIGNLFKTEDAAQRFAESLQHRLLDLTAWRVVAPDGTVRVEYET